MVKPELGTKRVCVSCGTKFYDLGKQPAVCPKCGAEQPADVARIRRPVGNVVEEKRRPKPTPAPELEDADVEVEATEDADSDEDVLEDTSDLEDGGDGIGDVEVEPEHGEEER